MSLIEVENVIRNFKIYKREQGFLNNVKSLFQREYEIKNAVNDVSFHIDKGELVGYIGPNGAGKSTTIKMLAGILVPTSGSISVSGRIPYTNRKQNAMHIGVVFGQRSQLFWELPMMETFDLYREMYKIDKTRFGRNVEFFIELLDMKEFINRPVRQLSLGQKMRADIAVSLLHDPEILYLDEPTIGLDIVAKDKIREFIREVNKEKKTTVVLTTHDMIDIEKICDRIIMIDKGKILYDGNLKKFKDSLGKEYQIIVDFNDNEIQISENKLKIVRQEGNRKWIQFNKSDISVAEAVTLITRNYDISDLNIKEPDVEDIVRRIYQKKDVD